MTKEEVMNALGNADKHGIIGNTIPKKTVLRVLAKLYSEKCTNCKHCDEVNERLIHCSYFEQYMPIEIGKCDMWERRDLD